MSAAAKAALAGVAIATAVGLAGTAHADSYGSVGDHDASAYTKELSSAGLARSTTGDPAGLASSICHLRSTGNSEKDLIEINEDQPMSFKQAAQVVLGAEFHFCPQYATTYNIAKGGAS